MLSYLPKIIQLLLSDQGCQVGWQAIRLSSLALWLHRLSKEYSIIEWLGLSITWKSWNSISSLFACLFYIPIYLYSLFISPVCFPRNNKKKHFVFIIIRHELCFPPTHNPLMKLSNVLFRKFLHLSLYVFLWICVCKLSYVSLYMFCSIAK